MPRRSRRAARRGRFLHARVVAAEQVTRHMRRITLGAPEIADFQGHGGDEFVRLLFAPPGQDRPVLPVSDDWWQEMRALPAAERPILRNYTVRRMRRDRAEVDIDFVLHGDTGPASRWAARAETGDQLGMLEQHATYAPGPAADWQLLVGDETALPAIGAILEGLTPGTWVEAFVEVPSAEDLQDLPTADGVQVHWLPRAGADDCPGALVQRAVRAASLPDGRGYAWVAGEAGMTTAVRRHLVNDRSLAKDAVEFCGYWRRDRPAYD